MKKENWVWMPHPGHLIVSDMCRFVLNTYVGGYIVSTVGEYWPSREVRLIHAKVQDEKWLQDNSHLKGNDFDNAYMKRFGFERLGAGEDDIYETMVFKARKTKHGCCPWTQVPGLDVEMDRYSTPEAARIGHLKMCNKWSRK